jgi:hypothetical protein
LVARFTVGFFTGALVVGCCGAGAGVGDAAGVAAGGTGEGIVTGGATNNDVATLGGLSRSKGIAA